MAREGSKRQIAIDIMNSHAAKSMGEVLPLIAKANGIDASAARSYYVWIVKKGMAKGKIETAPRKAAEGAGEKPTATRKRQPKEAAAPRTKAEAVKKLEKGKSPEEIARIKEANLQRMKNVMAKSGKTAKAS